MFTDKFTDYNEIPFWGIRLPKVEIDESIKKKIGATHGEDN